MTLTTEATLQVATVISKTTQTTIGQEIGCASYDYITLFFTYVKGDETGLDIQAHFLRTTGGDAHQEASWTAAGGVKTLVANEYNLTASATSYIIIDIRGINYIKFTQGGSNNDGTPDGDSIFNNNFGFFLFFVPYLI